MNRPYSIAGFLKKRIFTVWENPACNRKTTNAMRSDLTRQSLSNTVFFFILILVVLWSADFIFQQPENKPALSSLPHKGFMPLGTILQQWLQPSRIVEIAISFVILFINAFFVVRIVVRNLIYSNKTYISALIYLIACIGLFNSSQHYISLVSTLLLMNCLEKILKVSKHKSAVNEYFMGGVFIGVAAIIYGPSILFFPLCIISFIIFRRFEWREFTAALAGIFLPVFLCGYVLWTAGGEPLHILSLFGEAIRFRIPGAIRIASYSDYLPNIAFMVLAAAMCIVSLIRFIKTRRAFRTRAVKAIYIFIWFLMICFSILIFTESTIYDMAAIIAIPVAVIGPLSFKEQSLKTYNYIIFALLILSAVAANVIPFFIR